MKRLFHAFLLPILCLSFCSTQAAIAQTDTIGTEVETGFAVITPLDGNIQGVTVSEVFGQDVGGIVFRSSVLPSPLVTATRRFLRVQIRMRHSIRESPSLIQMRSRQRSCCH